MKLFAKTWDYKSDYHKQGPDLYAFIGFIGFIGPDDINYLCWTLSNNMCNISVIKYQY